MKFLAMDREEMSGPLLKTAHRCENRSGEILRREAQSRAGGLTEETGTLQDSRGPLFRPRLGDPSPATLFKPYAIDHMTDLPKTDTGPCRHAARPIEEIQLITARTALACTTRPAP